MKQIFVLIDDELMGFLILPTPLDGIIFIQNLKKRFSSLDIAFQKVFYEQFVGSFSFLLFLFIRLIYFGDEIRDGIENANFAIERNARIEM